MKAFKTFWGRRNDCVWYIAALQSLDLRGKQAPELSFYPISDDLITTQVPSAGTIGFFLGESIVPIVAIVEGEDMVRCLGTGFFVSCSGLLITAAHVITDPIERKYSRVSHQDDVTWYTNQLNFGVLLPLNPLFEGRGYRFLPFEWSMLLAERRESPLPFAGVSLNLNSDIAICKIPARGDGSPHQPLTMIQPGMSGVGMTVGSTSRV